MSKQPDEISTIQSKNFQSDEAFALQCDTDDPLAGYRDQFFIPPSKNNTDTIYFTGNSLGLQPKTVGEVIQQELDDWGRLAVDAHFEGKTPWFSYHEIFRDSGARLVGALPGEVVMMNSLTVNLHLMMISFYRPTNSRYKILTDDPGFPSDTYALKTQLKFHGYDPDDGLVLLKPHDGEHTIHQEDIESVLQLRGDEIALVMMNGVNFFTGQVFDMQRITEAAKQRGCVVGFDLAHAAGNIPMQLHDWNVDFAVWCNYKYLNSGPGAVGGCYVHESHGNNLELNRFGGWWGNNPDTRFKMHLQPEFIPQPGAAGWQVSNPPIFALAGVKASMDLFDAVGMNALREKSKHLTAYLQFLIDQIPSKRFKIITPRQTDQRGCQLSLLVHDRPRDLICELQAEGVVCDFREPNVVRVAPVPFYNTFHEAWRFAQVLKKHDRV